MKSKTVKVQGFGVDITATITQFESVTEAVAVLGETEVLHYINWTHTQTERARLYTNAKKKEKNNENV